jgi:hypothetical protein
LVFWEISEENPVKGAPKLTPRQRAFLDKLRELYREHRGPVHYSDVAAGLGVSRFSAYDMLKVLEKKGFASSTYALATGHSGPGRSMVMFSPTAQTPASPVVGQDRQRLDGEWQRVRERVLTLLQQAREAEYRETLNDLITRLPDPQAPLDFCTEMIGVLLLNMRRAKARTGGMNPFKALATLRPNSAVGLETLAGLSLGATLSAEDEAGSSLTRRLLDLVNHYQLSLDHLSEEARAALGQFLEEALDTLDNRASAIGENGTS